MIQESLSLPCQQLEVSTISQRTATSAKKPSQHSGADRRAGPRFPCRLEALCQISPSGKDIPARIVDISVGGIGLIVKERFEEGTEIAVRLLTTAVSRPLPVQVIYVAEVAPSFYLVGGAFTKPLKAQEIKSLIH